MKKIILSFFVLIVLVFSLSSCETECDVCHGRGEVKEDCYYYAVGYGRYILDDYKGSLTGNEYAQVYHDYNCSDPYCIGYEWIKCEKCNGTGVIEE